MFGERVRHHRELQTDDGWKRGYLRGLKLGSPSRRGLQQHHLVLASDPGAELIARKERERCDRRSARKTEDHRRKRDPEARSRSRKGVLQQVEHHRQRAPRCHRPRTHHAKEDHAGRLKSTPVATALFSDFFPRVRRRLHTNPESLGGACAISNVGLGARRACSARGAAVARNGQSRLGGRCLGHCSHLAQERTAMHWCRANGRNFALNLSCAGPVRDKWPRQFGTQRE
jgi:hypothetical protein